MQFCHISGLSKLLPEEKMALKKALPEGILALKNTYRTWIWLSKSHTGQESGPQIFLLDMIFLSGKSMIILIMHDRGAKRQNCFWQLEYWN